MRTTIALDDDLLEKLKEIAHQRGVSLREIVNQTLRRGLSAQEPRAVRRKPFRVEPFRSSFRTGIDPLRLNQLTDELEAGDASAKVQRR